MSKQAANIRKKGVGEEEARSIALNQFERFGISPGPEVNRIVDDFARQHAKENKDAVTDAATKLALSRFTHNTIARMRGEEPGEATTLAMRTVKASPEERLGYEKWAKTEEKAGREPTDARWNDYAIKGMAMRDFTEKKDEREEYAEWLKGHPEITPGRDALLAFRAEQRGGEPVEYAPRAPKTEIAKREMPKRETTGERITRLKEKQKEVAEKAAAARQARAAEKEKAAATRAEAAKEKREEAADKQKAAQKVAEEKRQAKLEEMKMKRREAVEAAKARLEERRTAREAEAKAQEETARAAKREELAEKAAAAAVPKAEIPKPGKAVPPAPEPVAIAAAPGTKAPKKAEPKPVAVAPEASAVAQKPKEAKPAAPPTVAAKPQAGSLLAMARGRPSELTTLVGGKEPKKMPAREKEKQLWDPNEEIILNNGTPKQKLELKSSLLTGKNTVEKQIAKLKGDLDKATEYQNQKRINASLETANAILETLNTKLKDPRLRRV